MASPAEWGRWVSPGNRLAAGAGAGLHGSSWLLFLLRTSTKTPHTKCGTSITTSVQRLVRFSNHCRHGTGRSSFSRPRPKSPRSIARRAAPSMEVRTKTFNVSASIRTGRAAATITAVAADREYSLTISYSRGTYDLLPGQLNNYPMTSLLPPRCIAGCSTSNSNTRMTTSPTGRRKSSCGEVMRLNGLCFSRMC